MPLILAQPGFYRFIAVVNTFAFDAGNSIGIKPFQQPVFDKQNNSVMNTLIREKFWFMQNPMLFRALINNIAYLIRARNIGFGEDNGPQLRRLIGKMFQDTPHIITPTLLLARINYGLQA